MQSGCVWSSIFRHPTRRHPGVEVTTRNRSGVFREALVKGVPDAVQVAVAKLVGTSYAPRTLFGGVLAPKTSSPASSGPRGGRRCAEKRRRGLEPGQPAGELVGP